MSCVHAQVAIYFINLTQINFICTWFSKAKYEATYTTNFLPVNSSNMWAHTDYIKPLPNFIKRMHRRPKAKRKRHVIDDGFKYLSVRIRVNKIISVVGV